MTKYIRWSGLAGFSVILALLVAFFYFAAAPIIKFTIEKLGTQAVGAEVNVKDVKLGFSPLVLSIQGVQVTDKNAPMTNMLSFESAQADLALFPLLLGKTIIEDMKLNGVEFGSARQNSGALPVEKAVEEKAEDKPEAQNQVAQAKSTSSEVKESKTESSALPSADEILEREPLLTITRGEKFKTSSDDYQTQMDNALADLPTEADLKGYQTQLDKIIKGKFKSAKDFKKRKKAFDALKKDFKQDQKAIKQAASVFKAAKKDLSSQWSLLKKAPGQDFKTIKGKYTLDAAGTSNVAALLFGDDAGTYAAKALEYYEIAKPLLEDDEADELQANLDKRLSGEFVHFPTDRPLPDFWIKKLSFTGNLSIGKMDVKVNDITHQQDVINKATRLSVLGTDMPAIKQLKINGVLDHRNGQNKDSFDTDIQRWQLTGVKLGLAGLKLNKSNVNVQASMVLENGQITASGNSQFHQTKFSSKDKTLVAKEMVLALANINSFTVDGTAKGELTHPSVKMKSNLDNKLKAAFDKRIKQKQKELEKKLKSKLADKLLAYSGDYKDQLKQLNLTEGSLGDKSKAVKGLLDSKMGDYESQAKADAKAKADKKKKELDKKKEALAKKAKDKLKKLF